MAIESRKKEINGITFEVTQLPYFKAQRLFTRLLKLLGPGLMALAQAAGAAGGRALVAAIASKDVSDFAPALSSLFDGLDPEDAERLTKQILDGARVVYNGKLVDLVENMDVVVGGDFWTGLAVQAWALSVHFGNFSSARGAANALGLKVKPSSSEASSTSTASTDGRSSAQGG